MWKNAHSTHRDTPRKIHNFYYQKRGDKANEAYTRHKSDNNKENKEKERVEEREMEGDMKIKSMRANAQAHKPLLLHLVMTKRANYTLYMNTLALTLALISNEL